MRTSLGLLMITGLGAGAACSFDHRGVPPTDALVDPGDDGGGIAQIWRDDSVDDFSIGSLDDEAVLEPWGAIGPAAWLTGALRARASNDRLFTDPEAATWAALEAATPAGVGLSELAPAAYGSDRPRGLGLNSSDTFTVWLDGEVWLEEGTHTWSLTADDAGFLELAAPGAAETTRVVSATFAATMNATYRATVTGWHRIRVGFVENVGNAELALRLQPPGSNALASIAPDRLRVRADDLTGLHWLGFDDSLLVAPRLGPFLFAADGFAYRPGNGELTGLGFTETDRLAMRWTGQLRIDVAGAYTFRLETDDGQRMWLDGAAVLDFWTDSPQDRTTAPIELDVGWHDLVVDLSDNTGGQEIRLRVTDGPDLAGGALPRARLRPVPPRHERTLGAVLGGGLIPDNGALDLGTKLAAPAGAVARAVEVAFTLNHSHWDELAISLIAPDDTAYVVIPVGGATGSGTRTVRRTVATPGEAVTGGWSLVIEDTELFDLGSVQSAALTVRYTGGEPPIAITAAYQSPIEELGAVVGFDRISWAGRLPPGSSVAVRMRTCATIGGCAVEPWSPPVTTSGARPAVLAGRFAQYRIELTSDGDLVPSVDWIEIAYRAAR